MNTRACVSIATFAAITLQGDVSRLITDMEKSIAEAAAFIDPMKTQ